MPRSSRSWHVEPNTRVTVELGGAEQSTVAAIAHDARDASAEPAVATEAESPAQPTAPIPFTTSDLLDAHRVAHERPVPLTAARHEPTPSAPETSMSEARPAETKSSALVPDVPVDPSPRIASTNDSAGSVSTPSESDLASAAAPPDADAAAPTDPTVATEPRPRGKDRDGASVDASSRGHADASVGARPPRPSGRFDGEPGEGGERSRSSSKPEPAPLSRRTSERRFDATDAGSAHSATTVPSEPANPGLPPPGVTAPERAAPSTAPSTSPERASPDPAAGEVATPKTLRMTLEPPDGGSVEVRLELRGESVHAHIVTSDPGLGASLDSGRDDLREHFRQQHLELAHLDVSTGGGSQGTFTQDPRDDRSPSWRDRDDERAITTTSGASARRVLQPSVRAVGGSEGSRALDVRA
ncbi:MAG: flagellar hook-length control protein FliK [bacterium]